MTWFDVILSIVSTIAVPYVLVLAQKWANANAQDRALARWTAGAASFAAQAYIDLARARDANPSAPLQTLVHGVAKTAAAQLMLSYRETADKVGATTADGVSKVKGEIGKLLAVDPTVAVVAPKDQPPVV